MNNNREQTEENIDLKDLCIYILRNWRILLIAMVTGAILLGTYKGILKPDAKSFSATDQKKIQDQMDANNKTLSTYNSSIFDNNNKISENTRIIESDQADLEIQENLISELESIISKYSNAGLQAVESLTDANIQLAAAKKKVYDYQVEIKVLQNQNDSLTKSIDSLREKVQKLNESNNALSSSLSPLPTKPSIKLIIKYIIIGDILGAFIICVISIIKYFLYNKLRDADELKEKYNARVLGSLYMPPKRKNHTKIDTLLDKWSGYSNVMDDEKKYNLISAAIQVMSTEKDKSIILTGTVQPVIINNVFEKLKGLLPQDTYKLCAVENPVYNADSLLKIKQATVIIVESKDISDKHEIDKLSELLYAGKVEILGSIML